MEISIEAKELKKEYPSRLAVSNLSFQVKKGSIHGFLGPNGAGKTTTLKMLAGLLSPSQGSFHLSGRLGFLPENPPLYGNMTVNDYLKFVYEISGLKFNPERILEVKKMCGLSEVGERLIANLSKGYKQRVGIAQSIVFDPEIIILDEPTTGLDPVALIEVRNLILSLKGRHTILFSSHQLHEVEFLCEDITLINQGKVLYSGEMKSIGEKIISDKIFKAKVKNFNQSINSKLKSDFPIESIEHTIDENGTFMLSIYGKNNFSKSTDLIKLTQALSDTEIGLFEFYEEALSLEEIFKRLTLKDSNA